MPKPVSPESPSEVVANPEHDRRLRRRFSAEDKRRILSEAEPAPSADNWPRCYAGTPVQLPARDLACPARARGATPGSRPRSQAARR